MAETILSLISRQLGRPAPAPGGALAQRLEDTFTAAAQRWPGVALTRAAYAARLAGLCEGKPDPDEALAPLQLEELYLAAACAAGDPRAVLYFDEQYLSQVPTYVARLRMSAAQVEEVQHSLRERLVLGASPEERRISGYLGQGALSQWLRIAAVRSGLNLLRSKDEKAVGFDPDAGLEHALARDGDPELEYLRRRYQHEFKAAVRAAFAALSEDDRGVLHMYYIGRLNTRQIAKLYNVVPTTASRWVATARDRVAEDARAHLRARLQVNDTEMQSLFRALGSQIDLSIRAALDDGKAKKGDDREPDGK